MIQFDPSTSVSPEFGIFGIPTEEKNSQLVLLPVPWEVTTSYGAGASLGPALIREASSQIDLFDLETGKAYEAGYFMKEISEDLKVKNDILKEKAQKVIQLRTDLSNDEQLINSLCNDVNSGCADMVNWVYEHSKKILAENKLLGLIGGDHSTPLGAIRALAEKYNGNFAVLHFDAHADLRNAYQGFKHSHASIMYNVMNENIKPKKLVQVGIRDFCEEEFNYIQSREDIKTFFDLDLKKKLLNGKSWDLICQEILNELPEKVYISFDIDGLDPVYCPNTGTPVPGGLSIDQVFYLFQLLHKNKKQIIGFDLNEVSSGGLPIDEASEWDGNVGSRVLYKLCGWSILTNH
ncbi:MAG: agmatinase family protein [Bdellovibrionaceae bacterium]|nr:agmatinase family protein [Pseudobdellovibrionaceae bacterium]NUM59266.1 agmatinase family protein [Pseudobdellovibrionaceae bacterium]